MQALLPTAQSRALIVTMPGSPDPDQVRLFRENFDARHRGAGKTKRTAILTGGADIKTIAMKLADLEVGNLTTISDKKICSTFGVPPGIAGLITEAQYSHGPAMRQFILIRLSRWQIVSRAR